LSYGQRVVGGHTADHLAYCTDRINADGSCFKRGRNFLKEGGPHKALKQATPGPTQSSPPVGEVPSIQQQGPPLLHLEVLLLRRSWLVTYRVVGQGWSQVKQPAGEARMECGCRVCLKENPSWVSLPSRLPPQLLPLSFLSSTSAASLALRVSPTKTATKHTSPPRLRPRTKPNTKSGRASAPHRKEDLLKTTPESKAKHRLTRALQCHPQAPLKVLPTKSQFNHCW